MPTPEPISIDTTSADTLIAALKNEGFLDPSATCELQGIPAYLRAPIFASLLYMAREFPLPFRARPLADVTTFELSDSPAIARYWPRGNRIEFNSAHKYFSYEREKGFKGVARERFVHFIRGVVVHEATHKLQEALTPEHCDKLDHHIGKTFGDWRSAYPHAFSDIADSFRAVFGRHGTSVIAERDAMAMEYWAHGLPDEYCRAVHATYKEFFGEKGLTGTTRLHEAEPCRTQRIRLGEYSIGNASQNRLDTFECNDANVYYFRCENRRFVLSNGLLLDVDGSIRARRLITQDFQTNNRFVLTKGLPPSAQGGSVFPADFDSGRITEVVSVSRSWPNSSAVFVKAVDRNSISDIAHTIHEDLLRLKQAAGFTMETPRSSPLLFGREHFITWRCNKVPSWDAIRAFFPHARELVVTNQTGQQINLGLPYAYGFVRNQETSHRRGQEFRVEPAQFVDDLSNSGCIQVEGNSLGTILDFGQVKEMRIVDDSVLGGHEIAQAMGGRYQSEMSLSMSQIL